MKVTKRLILVCVVFVLAFLNVFGVTLLDFIANDLMFKHGLEYSIEWFLPWGIGLNLTSILSGVTNGVMYWIGRIKEKRRIFTSLLIALTTYWQVVSGNEDMLWFGLF